MKAIFSQGGLVYTRAIKKQKSLIRVMSQRTSQNRRGLPVFRCKLLKGMAGTTGLEPAASAVTAALETGVVPIFETIG